MVFVDISKKVAYNIIVKQLVKGQKKMEIKTAQVVQDYTCLEVEILQNYSGRGMYGSTTVGLVMDGEIDDVLIPLALMALEVEPGSQEAAEIEGVLDDLGRIRQDSLGLRKVYY